MDARILPSASPALTSPAFSRKFAAFLFDMDGTLINSLASAERAWGAWAVRNGLDPVTFLPTIHGIRGVDMIASLALPGLDPIEEAAKILAAEMDDLADIVALPGVVAFLNSLPADSWAIVTSAPIELARKRLAAAGVPAPNVMVASEDVTSGKPDPRCFLLGAERLGVNIADCIVFEDAHAGIKAGERAGAALMVITATHRHKLDTPHPTMHSYEVIRAQTHEDGWISLHNPA
jgi:mannitol-1-/sugar-/sorbitol-6-phosphatase